MLEFNMMGRKKLSLFILLSIFFVVGCGTGGSVYIPKNYEVDPPPAEQEPEEQIDLESNEFSDPYDEVWAAAIESVKWIQWPAAYVDESEGVIRLKEAYVYRKAGKLFRKYTWPTKDALITSDINDYVEKISNHKPKTGQTVFTQENLEIKLVSEKEDITRVNIEYSIRPYTYSGKIGYEIPSNGYIENLILDRMRETLDGSPVAKY